MKTDKRPLSAKEACDAALDAMCSAAGWPKGTRPEYDHYPYPFSIHGGSSEGYYARLSRLYGSAWIS